ncbi:pyridoxamine 5'-phosphate oxidase [Halobacteriales archaeon QS_8_69_26]|nr:MAG: pyridoxamine 5'-phosphate oxidase [Halobacteriales archaeon QS_8_69_26]
MIDYAGAWDEAGVAEFLAEATIPLRLACRTPGSHLWMVSLWFRHRDGRLECATGRDADVVRYLRSDPGVAFEVSTNDPPYRGVRGRGTVEIEPDPEKAVLRDLLERYLGGTDSRLARRLLDEGREEVTLRIDPAKVYSWDFSDRMHDVAREGE